MPLFRKITPSVRASYVGSAGRYCLGGIKLFTFALLLMLISCGRENEVSSGDAIRMNVSIMEDRIIVFDRQQNRLTLFNKNGVLINEVDLTDSAGAKNKAIFAKSFERQIHDWNDTIFVKLELIGDKLYWHSKTSGLNIRNTSNLSVVSSGGMEITLCGSYCDWTGVYDSDSLLKVIHYNTHGVVRDVSVEEFNNIRKISFRAISKR